MGWFPFDYYADVTADPVTVWSALTSPPSVAGWLGRLDQSLSRPGQKARLWVGPDDVYALVVNDLTTNAMIEVSLSHLYVENPMQVTFTIRALAAGRSRVALRVLTQEESPADLAREHTLWQARHDALIRQLHGLGTYPDLDSFVIDVAMPGIRWSPLHADNIRGWLPVSGTEQRCTFFVVDGAGPRAFPITRWLARYDELLEVSIAAGPAGEVTHAVLQVAAVEDSLRLRIEHSGWTTLRLGLEQTLSLRARFRDAWAEATRNALAIGDLHERRDP